MTKNGETKVIGVGTKVRVEPHERRLKVIVLSDNFSFYISVSSIYKYIKGFYKFPSMKALEKQLFDGVALSPTHNKVEIDGQDIYGFYSYHYYMGIV